MLFTSGHSSLSPTNAPIEHSQKGIDEYRRIMYDYMQSQLNRGTIPGYRRIMHAHTMEQLESMKSTRSEAGSPVLAQVAAVLPSPVKTDGSQTTIDNAPIPPNNSPSPEKQKQNDTRMRQRSRTDPIPRDFGALWTSVACG
ncbi:hypothetical protein CERZMDRAFT_100293 [Cercospora zeae-maydis SCOH1-5]|uniref:Uncharacterized protein n=1 Tax=Cercospora zeae-maydis SCOH1-5 TaxID=717836 RepID=A0A6A6F7V1_9PEZI|nr:hypothetical protein CERZMDRAFT_100293 [Cercospora zeae-maydis SCOH1-5]